MDTGSAPMRDAVEAGGSAALMLATAAALAVWLAVAVSSALAPGRTEDKPNAAPAVEHKPKKGVNIWFGTAADD